MRIALLAHSTNPRGGVVHALELGDALTRLGHAVAVHAPDPGGNGFFRPTLCGTVSVASPATANPSDVTAMVETRAAAYVRHFGDPARRRFDVFHAQDGISGNALATLKQQGVIAGFGRTVHHVETFRDPRLMGLQERAIVAADRLFVVSALWREHLDMRFGRTATIVGNGVDRAHYRAQPDGREPGLRARLGLAGGPVLLAVGGVEARKNTLGILEAFCIVRHALPDARLVIAGGASVLDHHDYQDRFATRLAASGLPSDAVVIAGPVPQADMPALYRIADALVFPSVQEGFGLVVLEAMASGVPVVTSRIAPFTEHLGAADVAWCDPATPGSIAAAILGCLTEPRRADLIAHGHAVAARHDWRATATAHLADYAALREPAHA
jgi:glycosyltransferase-like protein